MTDDNFIKSYLSLLIKQYYYKPKAKAEITLLAAEFSKVYTFLNTFTDKFDVDRAEGEQLDIIGQIVGISRTVPEALANYYFGFEGEEYAKGFSDKFNDADSAPFFDRFSIRYSDLQLEDEKYRFFIKAKIAVNNASAYMISDERTSIQSIIQYLFNDDAYVVDNQDMSLTLYLSPSVRLDAIRLINKLNLLPKPQGVNYRIIVKAGILNTFGFSSNPNAIGFGDKFNYRKGYFAEKIIL